MRWLQRHWDARAATNFILGGAGSGLLVAGTLGGVANEVLVVLSLALMAAGLAAVWLEIGRKLRAAHVFLNPFTSWMTRESFAAVAVFALAAAYLWFKDILLLFAAAVAAAAFLGCQARMLREAKGIPAWRAPEVVPLVVFTGLAEGSGLALLFAQEDALLAIFALAVVGRWMAWRRYGAAVRSEPLAAPGRMIVSVGSVTALALALAAYFVPDVAALAGAAALVPGWRLKLALVTRASVNQGFALPRLPVRGAR